MDKADTLITKYLYLTYFMLLARKENNTELEDKILDYLDEIWFSGSLSYMERQKIGKLAKKFKCE